MFLFCVDLCKMLELSWRQKKGRKNFIDAKDSWNKSVRRSTTGSKFPSFSLSLFVSHLFGTLPSYFFAFYFFEASTSIVNMYFFMYIGSKKWLLERRLETPGTDSSRSSQVCLINSLVEVLSFICLYKYSVYLCFCHISIKNK